MKSLFGDTGSNESCSCPSYFNDLDSPSLRRLLAQDNRPDRIFNGNQIPLRESKLIEKLIKTRALYDDIRNQLLSSSLSKSSKSDLKPRLSPLLKREVLAKTKRAGNIFHLDDSFNKEAVSETKKISECCSCCSCHSKAHLNKHVQKGRKHAHAGGYVTSKSSVLSKSGNGEELRLGRSFKTKNIKSDPCTCACESHVLKELIKLQSRVALRKIRPEQPTPAIQDKYHSIIKDKYKMITVNNKKLKDSYHKLKRTKIRPSQYPDDMGEGGGKAMMKLNNLRSDFEDMMAKKSVEQFRVAQSNNKDNFISDGKYTQKHKEDTTTLKKDSYPKKVPATKFRDQVKVKRELPTQNSELKQKITTRPRKSNLESVLKNKKNTSSTSTISIRKERGTSPLKTGIKKREIHFRKPSKINFLTDSHINVKHDRAVADGHAKSQVKETAISVIPREKKNSVKSMTDFLQLKTHTGIENRVQKPITVRRITDDVPMRFSPTRRSPPVNQITAKKPVKSIFTNTVVKRVSQKNVDTSSFETDAKKSSSSLRHPKKPKKSASSSQPSRKNIMFVKKNKHVGKHNLKRCFCTLKLKVKDTTSKLNKNIKIKSGKTRTTQSVQTMICAPAKKRSSNSIGIECTDYNMKMKKESEIMYLTCFSTTFTQTSTPLKSPCECECPDEDITFQESQGSKYQNNIICECSSNKQNEAMTFQPGYTSINISKTSKEKSKRRDKRKHLKHKQSQISDLIGRSKFRMTKRSSHRCVCTFKLGKKEKKNKLPVKLSKGTSFPESTSRNLKARPSLRKLSRLSVSNVVNSHVRRSVLTDECDPGLCVPGKCIPTKCKDLLTRREGRKKRLNKRIQSTVQYQKPKSGGFICHSLQLLTAKKIHSIGTSHKSEVAIQIVKKIICKNVPKSSSHKVTPSFAIKFLKKHSSSLLFPFKGSSKMERGINTQPLQDHKLKDNKPKRKSILMRRKQHDNRSSLGPAMKRCLLLVLHKKCKRKTRNSAFGKDCIVVVDNNRNSFKNVAKAIKTKCSCSRQLKHNIRRSSKDSGMITQKARMVSKSSDTRKLETQSKDFYEKPEFNQSASQRLKKICKYSQFSKSSTDCYSEKRGISLNSNLSFNIEFSKEILTENDNIKRRRKKNKFDNAYKYSKEQKYKYQCYQVPYSTAKLKPILKKCSCTLKVEKRERNRSIKYFAPIIAANSQVYALNTVTAAKNKFNAPGRILFHKNNPNLFREDSYSTNYTKKALSRKKLWQYLKKEKTSSVYSISTIAYTSEKTYIRQSKCKLLQSRHNLLDVTSEETVKFESKLCFKVKQLKSSHSLIDIMSSEQLKRKYVKDNTINAPKIIKQIINNSQLTGIQPLIKKCYCTMNIQVATQQNGKRRHYQHKPHKLKDYECEPGVCIPYECDPHECKKMIMKRLMRKVSRMSGTERRLRNSSSLTSTTSSSSKTRGLQSSLGHTHHAVAKDRPTGVKYQTLPRSPKTQKQAVRVGSVFSFDIEFSKNTGNPSPVTDMVTIPKRRSASISSKPHRKDRGTGGYRPERYHRESQSMMKQLRDRASSVTPMIQRCFCTLKLQKKGKQQKERELQGMNQGTSTPTKFQVQKPVLRTIETGQNTKTIKKPELLPYECEPNICVPGECDPYACLELIKKRMKRTREFGTESMAGKLTSSSSMTTRTKKTRKKSLQSRNIRVRPIKSRDTAVISKPSLMTIDRPATSSRQAVRIGSSFNFNIEFYKDNAVPHVSDRRPPEQYEERTPKHVRRHQKHVHAHRKTRESYSQESRKTTHDTDSQISLLNRQQSTMTSSILKRCFCTAKLHETAPKQSVTDSMLKRCLCTLKSFTSAKKTNYQYAGKHEKVPKKVTPPKQTHIGQTQTRKRYPALEPYECEPGICVPGLCDPYECEKLIRKRNLKEKMIGTTGPRTRSTSSSFMSSKTSKALMTQAALNTPHDYIKSQSPKEIVVKEPRSPALPRKQAVKIGSSFSFNIEFYKDNLSNNNQVHDEAMKVRKAQPVRYKTRKDHHRSRTRDMALRTRSRRLRSRESQMNEVIKKDKSFGPMLKRCFCTLKLHKKKVPSKPVKKNKSMHRGTATHYTKEVPAFRTRSVMTNKRHKSIPYKLEPYECEPGVCVPGECDPHECEKRIRKRLRHRASGTTYRHRTRSNMVKPRRKYRDSNVQSAFKNKEGHTRVQEYRRPEHRRPEHRRPEHRRPEIRSTVVEGPSRQAVKVGSNFSFNIEFYKDRSPNTSIPSSRPIKQYSTYEKPRRTASRSTNGRSISSKNKISQRNRAVRDTDSQVLGTKMRSTMTGVGPFLKRCFCTLQLYKSQKDGSFGGNTRLPKTKIAAAKATTATQPVAKPHVAKTSHAKSSAAKKLNTKTLKTTTVKTTVVKKPTTKTPTVKKTAVKTTVGKTSTKKTSAKKESHKKDAINRKNTKTYNRKLEPYECEPGVCIPGECDPYECEKRIKRRMRSRDCSCSTLSHRRRSVSSSIEESKTLKPRTSQSSPITYPTKKQEFYDTCPSQQVVRIGSNFSFNIEFFKDRSPQDLHSRDVHDVPKIKYKPHEMKGTETRYKTRSVSSYSRSRQRDSQSQSDSLARLKRCFCTLKLQKKGKQQQTPKVKIEPTSKTTGTHTVVVKTKMEPVAREIGTKTKKYSHILEPYECEPGVCIPGLCDPYECEKRIKLRQMKNFGTETTGIPMKSMSISTLRDRGTKSMNTQLLREKKYKQRHPSTKTLYRANRSHRPSHGVKPSHRQYVRMGSNMSFNVEFFKDRSSDQDESIAKPVRYKSKTSVSTANEVKLRDQGSNRKERALRHGISQAGISTESKGSGMGPMLKRCFCTLTLQRAEVKNTLHSSMAKNKPVKATTTTQEKSTSTKNKHKPPVVKQPRKVPHKLEPYECEPNVCIPGQCDPYECLERIKRRGIRRTSRTTGTRMKRPSQVSVSSMAAQLIPGYRSKVTQDNVPRKVERIVEEPRFTFLSNARRQTVKISSNFSFNIEFFRERCPEVEEKEAKVCKYRDTCRAKNICMECKKTGPGKQNTRIGQHDTRRDHLRNHDSQSEAVRTEDKSSAVAMLRRCFCTAKLHKGHLARTQHPQSLIVGRVEEVGVRPIFNPKEYRVQYLIQHPHTCKNLGNNKTKENDESESTENDTINLETIMSYTASKFNNIQSKTTFCGQIDKASCSICPCNLRICQDHRQLDIYSKNECSCNKSCSPFCGCGRKFCRKKRLVDAEPPLTLTTPQKGKFYVKTIQQNKSVNTKRSIFAKMLCRWKHLFAKHINEHDKNENNHNSPVKKAPMCQIVRETEMRKYRHIETFSRYQTGDGPENNTCVHLICPHCRFVTLQAIPNKATPGFSSSNGRLNPIYLTLDVQKQNIKEREYKDSITLLFNGPKNKCLENLNIIRPCASCGKIKTTKLKGPSYKLRKRRRCVCNTKKQKRVIVGVTKKANIVKPKKMKPCLCGRMTFKTEDLRCTKSVNDKLGPKKQVFINGTELCADQSQDKGKFTNKFYKRAQVNNNSAINSMQGAPYFDNMSKCKDAELKKKLKFRQNKTKKTPNKLKSTSDVLLVSKTAVDTGQLGTTGPKYILCYVPKAIFDKRTYKNIIMYLGNPMRSWTKSKNAADDEAGIPTLKRYTLRSQAMSFSKEPLGPCACKFHSKNPVKRGRPHLQQRVCCRRRLSQRKERWVTTNYKCARICPRCLGLLRVWRQFTDVLLFVLAVVLWCPCVSTMELCKVMMFSCVCKR